MNPKTTAINLSLDTFAESCDKVIAEKIKAKEESDRIIINTTFESIKSNISKFVNEARLGVKVEVRDYIYDNNLSYT